MKRLKLFPLAYLLLALSVSTFAQTDIESFIKKSAEYSQQDKLDEAAGELTKAIAVQPDNADLYLRRADLYRFLDKKEDLAADANKAAALAPDNKQVILTATRLLRNIERCAESLTIINNYIFNRPENDEVLSARSQSNMCLGDWASAYQDTLKASELNPANNRYRSTQAGLLAKLGDSANSFEQFAELIKALETKLAKTANVGQKESLKRDLAEIYRIRAGVNHAKADNTAEFADLVKFIEYSPTEFSYRTRGKIYQDHQMYVEAIADYTEAVRLSPTNSIFLLERGEIYAEAGKDEEALKDYQQSLKLDPTLKEIVGQKINYVRTRKK